MVLVRKYSIPNINSLFEGRTIMRSYFNVGVVLLFSIATTVLSEEVIINDTAYNQTCDTTYEKEIVHDTTYSSRDVKCFKIPVTYYDYHVDGSNPDFGYRVTSRWDQSGLEYANYSGWVDTVLDPETMMPRRHPALSDTNIFYNISWNIARLFTPWTEGTTDTFTLKFPPVIKDTIIEDTLVVKVDTVRNIQTVYIIDTITAEDGTMTFDTLSSRQDTTISVTVDSATSVFVSDTIPTPDTIMISDTMFKNIVIEDSITAYWVPFAFTFEDTTDSVWIFGKRVKIDPINGLGFGNESDSIENAGYALHIKNQFTYKGGEQIYFGADDDAYVFIDGKLAIECGGFHEAIIESLYLDSFVLADDEPLTADETYDIEIFMVERRQGGNIYLAGLSEFVNKGAIEVETFIDTLPFSYMDTTKVTIICNNVLGVNSPYKKVQRQLLFGLTIPPAAVYVSLEYFTISGAQVRSMLMPLKAALTNKPESLPCGMYVVRINFLNKRGTGITKPVFQRMVVKK